MGPITLGLISGGLSLFGGVGQKNANISAAKAGYQSTVAFTDRDYGVTLNALKIQGQEVGNELGMAMSDLLKEGTRAKSTMVTSTAERNVYGATASRQQRMVEMKTALGVDDLMQRAEAQAIDIGEQVRSAKYDREAKLAQARQQMNNTINSQPSTLSLLGNAVASGISGYSSGLGLQSAQTQLGMQKELFDMQKAETERLRALRG